MHPLPTPKPPRPPGHCRRKRASSPSHCLAWPPEGLPWQAPCLWPLKHRLCVTGEATWPCCLSQAASRNGPCLCSRWPSRDPEHEAGGRCRAHSTGAFKGLEALPGECPILMAGARPTPSVRQMADAQAPGRGPLASVPGLLPPFNNLCLLKSRLGVFRSSSLNHQHRSGKRMPL